MADPVYAFPHPSGAQGCDGMTLRDWFAGQALAPTVDFLMQAAKSGGLQEDIDETAFAKLAYRIADAMLAERERTPTT